MSASISRFTPSNLPAPVLERLFVARHALLDDLVARVRRAATSSERNHSLVVGPRGAGKTHLMSLVHHRVQAMADDGLAVQSAWLLEDPYRIGSYRDLLGEIVEAAGREHERGASIGELEQELLDAFADRGLIVMIVENFDDVLHAIGEDGQHRLRSFLQSEQALLLMATTTAVTRELNDEAWPFYGFFTTDDLPPLSVDEAALMLQRVAAEDGDDELVGYLDSDEAHARLRAIEHLAGGQPRIWAVLASALTVHGLSELVGLLLGELDALTPYYQEQMARLSPLQRRTVAELIDAESAVTVSELAERVDVDQRTMAKTLSELRQRRWVVVTSSPFTAWVDRRRSFYELAEPLARIAFQIKAARSTPIQLIVDFMKMWFDPHALDDADGLIERMYLVELDRAYESDALGSVVRGLRKLPAFRVPTVDLLQQIDDALHDLANRDPRRLLALPVPLRLAIEERLAEPDTDEFEGSLDRLRTEITADALDELGDVPDDRSAAWIERTERWLEVSGERPATLMLLVKVLSVNRRFGDARVAIESIEELLGPDDQAALTARLVLASNATRAGRLDDATATAEQVANRSEELFGPDHPISLAARGTAAASYLWAGRDDDAIATLEQVANRHEELLGPDHDSTLTAWTAVAATYLAPGRIDDAIAIGERVANRREELLGPDHDSTLTAWSAVLSGYVLADRIDDAIAIGERVANRREELLGPNDPIALAAWSGVASVYLSAGRIREAAAIADRVARAAEEVLGSDHPTTITTWTTHAGCRLAEGRLDDAVRSQERAADGLVELLGPDHASTLEALEQLSLLYRSAGRNDDATAIDERVAGR